MDVVEIGFLTEPFPWASVRCAKGHAVPTHMWHLEFARGKAAHLAGKDGKAFDSGALFAAFEQELVAHADPEKWFVVPDPVDEAGNQIPLAKLLHAIAERSLSGEEKKIDILHLFWPGDQLGTSAEGFQGLEEAPDVAPSVIDDTNLGMESHGFQGQDGEGIPCAGLERLLGAGDSLHPGINCHSGPEGPRERFEGALGDVMPIASIKDFEVNIGAQVRGESPEEFFHQAEGKILSVGGLRGSAEFQPGTVAEIDNDPGQAFIHRDISVAVTGNPMFVAQGFAQALAEDDPAILDCVMVIHLDISPDLQFQVNEGMAREQGEHVVKERDARLDRGFTAPIKVEGKLDVCLSGFSRLARPADILGHMGRVLALPGRLTQAFFFPT